MRTASSVQGRRASALLGLSASFALRRLGGRQQAPCDMSLAHQSQRQTPWHHRSQLHPVNQRCRASAFPSWPQHRPPAALATPHRCLVDDRLPAAVVSLVSACPISSLPAVVWLSGNSLGNRSKADCICPALPSLPCAADAGLLAFGSREQVMGDFTPCCSGVGSAPLCCSVCPCLRLKALCGPAGSAGQALWAFNRRLSPSVCC